jgi:hypothetical protein
MNPGLGGGDLLYNFRIGSPECGIIVVSASYGVLPFQRIDSILPYGDSSSVNTDTQKIEKPD